MEYNFNDAKIETEIRGRLRLIEAKGKEYGWTEVRKEKKPKKEKEPEMKRPYKSSNRNEEKDKEYVPYKKVNYYSHSNNDYYNQKGYYNNNYNINNQRYYKQYYHQGGYYNQNYGYNNYNYNYNHDYNNYNYNQSNYYQKRRKVRPQLVEVDSEYTSNTNKQQIEPKEEIKREAESQLNFIDNRKISQEQNKEREESIIISKAKIQNEPKSGSKIETKPKEPIQEKQVSMPVSQPMTKINLTQTSSSSATESSLKKQTEMPLEPIKTKVPETSFVHLAISTINQISVQPTRTTMGFTIESKKPSNIPEAIHPPQSQPINLPQQPLPQFQLRKDTPQEMEYPYQMPFYPPQYPINPAYFKYQGQGTPNERSNPYYQYPPYAMKYMMYPPYPMYDDQQQFYYPQPPKK